MDDEIVSGKWVIIIQDDHLIALVEAFDNEAEARESFNKSTSAFTTHLLHVVETKTARGATNK